MPDPTRTRQRQRLLKVKTGRLGQEPGAHGEVVRLEHPGEVRGRDHVLRELAERLLVRHGEVVRLVDVRPRLDCVERGEPSRADGGARPVLALPVDVHRLGELNISGKDARMRDLENSVRMRSHSCTK